MQTRTLVVVQSGKNSIYYFYGIAVFSLVVTGTIVGTALSYVIVTFRQPSEAEIGNRLMRSTRSLDIQTPPDFKIISDNKPIWGIGQNQKLHKG